MTYWMKKVRKRKVNQRSLVLMKTGAVGRERCPCVSVSPRRNKEIKKWASESQIFINFYLETCAAVHLLFTDIEIIYYSATETNQRILVIRRNTKKTRRARWLHLWRTPINLPHAVRFCIVHNILQDMMMNTFTVSINQADRLNIHGY